MHGLGFKYASGTRIISDRFLWTKIIPWNALVLAVYAFAAVAGAAEALRVVG